MKKLPPADGEKPQAISVYKSLTAYSSTHENYFFNFSSPFFAAMHKASTNIPTVPPNTSPKINQIKTQSPQSNRFFRQHTITRI